MKPLIPYDKALHISYGAALGLIGAMAALIISQPMWLGALTLATVVGVGKEVYDYVSKRGTPDFLDAVATIIGALPTVIVG